MSEKSEEEQSKEEKPLKRRHFKEQFDDEAVRLVFRKHPVVMRKGLILAMLGILIGPLYTLILTYANKNNPPSMTFFFGSLLFGLIFGIILIFPSWVRWYFSVYIMTDRRFIQQSRSLLQINVVDIGLDQIQMINYEVKGVQETLLNFGTIVVQTYVGDLVIRDVHRPAAVQKKMVHVLRDLGIHPTQRPLTDDDKRVVES